MARAGNLRINDCAGRTRKLKPSFFKDESLADCSSGARLLLTGLLVFSSKSGCLHDDISRIHGQIFLSNPEINIESLLYELIEAKAIYRYVSNGISYIQISNIKQWCEIHKNEKHHAHSAKRRALKRNSMPLWADADEIKSIYIQARQRTLNGESVHVDHVIPLAGKNVCGLHVHSNLRIISAKENLKKSNKFEVGE